MDVIGVSFHVGSGCGDKKAYNTAFKDASRVFKYADEIGMAPMTMVDIGGGFPGDRGGYGGPNMPTFQDIAQEVRHSIVEFESTIKAGLQPSRQLRYIAEPGRYFVSASTTIASKVYSRKGGHGNT